MSNFDFSNTHFETLTIHAGKDFEDKQNAVNVPIYQTTAFKFTNIDDASALYAGERTGFAYSRRGNPTNEVLENRLAMMEHGGAAIVTSSGMAAIGATMLTILEKGDHVVSGKVLYGGSDYMFRNNLPSYGIETTFVDTRNLEEIKSAIKPNTKVIYFETPANPTMEITDIKAVVGIAKQKGIKVVIDNTFAPPPVQYPLDLGADYVVYSLSKYINGHGDVVAGAVVSTKEAIEKIRMHMIMRVSGATIAPFQSFLILRGLKTLSLRIKQHCSSAMQVALFLENHPAVKDVFYPGLANNPQHELAKKQMNGMYTGMVAFELAEGYKGKTALEAGKDLLNNLNIISLAVSLGDPDSLIQHPASMTHCTVPKELRLASGISDGLVRLSVGLEHEDDIIADLKQALDMI